MFERSNLLSISLIASIALTRALEKTTAGPQWECFHTQIGLETTQYNTIRHQQNTHVIGQLYYNYNSMGMFSHSNRTRNNTIGRQQNTQIGQLYYNNGQYYYSIPATLWITLKSLSHPNKSPYSPTIGLIRIQFAI